MTIKLGRPRGRRNYPLIAMYAVGAVLTVFGLLVGVPGFSGPVPTGAGILGAGLFLWGIILLVIAWSISAVRSGR